MSVRFLHFAVVVSTLGAISACKSANDGPGGPVLYGADGFGKIAGNLYQVDPETASAAVVGPIGVAIRDLATRPSDGAVFGIGGDSGIAPRSFVSIDVTTGKATVISSEVSAYTLVFTQGSALRHLVPCGSLAELDPTTGTSTPLVDAPTPLPCGTTDNGTGGNSNTIVRLADGTGWLLAGDSTDGNPIIDLNTGLVLAPGPVVTRVVGVTRHLGTVYGVLGGGTGGGLDTTLVTIDPLTGEVTPVGELPIDLHALTSSAPDAR